MIMPIYAYGEGVLREISAEINRSFPKLDILIRDMWETMYHTNGVGIAAPQVGIPAKLFVVDSTPMYDEDGSEGVGVKKVFINAEIISENGLPWQFEEGCLSIPGIRENVQRKPEIKITYYDENFEKHTDIFDGYTARVIQHEYDHLMGVLFIDKISPLKKQLSKSKLLEIQRGMVKVDYKMKFARR
ncbi:MAG: peptide deformylase [Bacteroidetes bacterium]|nr:peptide deformylase [Bacteroidota bacterium]